MKNFDELEIDRAFISELTIVPSKKIRMTLLRGPREENAQVGREYDLQFSRVHDVTLNLQARPWLEIVSHNLLSESKYLTSYFEIHPEAEGRITKSRHFQVICDEGQIDVIAEEFSISLVNEIPYFESADDEIIK